MICRRGRSGDPGCSLSRWERAGERAYSVGRSAVGPRSPSPSHRFATGPSLSRRERVRASGRETPPSLPACFPNQFNAANPLILRLSRRRMINAPRGDGEGAKACDLRGLEGRSSGRARRRRSRQGSRSHPSGAGRAWNTDTAWDGSRGDDRRGETRAFRDRATQARPARRGLRLARSEQDRPPDAPGERPRGALVLVETVFLQKLPGLARRSAALPELQRPAA